MSDITKIMSIREIVSDRNRRGVGDTAIAHQTPTVLLLQERHQAKEGKQDGYSLTLKTKS